MGREPQSLAPTAVVNETTPDGRTRARRMAVDALLHQTSKSVACCGRRRTPSMSQSFHIENDSAWAPGLAGESGPMPAGAHALRCH